MEKDYPNKAMKPTDVKTKAGENYFFAGGTEYEPVTVIANSLEEATEQYEKIKKPINK